MRSGETPSPSQEERFRSREQEMGFRRPGPQGQSLAIPSDPLLGRGVLPASVRALGPGCDAQQAGGLT